MPGAYQSWLNSFGNGQDVSLIKEHDGIRFLYSKTIDYKSGGSIGPTMYHVWNQDKWVTCQSNYKNAYRHFQEEVKKLDWSEDNGAH